MAYAAFVSDPAMLLNANVVTSFWSIWVREFEEGFRFHIEGIGTHITPYGNLIH